MNFLALAIAICMVIPAAVITLALFRRPVRNMIAVLRSRDRKSALKKIRRHIQEWAPLYWYFALIIGIFSTPVWITAFGGDVS